jgi:hypothetical protein
LRSDCCRGEKENFRIEQVLTPGKYYVEVKGAGSRTTGAYRLHLEGPDFNPFEPGQCTWYVYNRVKKDGWFLRFSEENGRNANKWWNMITNSEKRQVGNPGDIMIFDEWSGSDVGHVLYVTSSGLWNGKRAWTVRHANWNNEKLENDFGQTVVDTIDNANIKQCTFVEDKNGIKLLGKDARNNKEILGNTSYPLKGFLSGK